MIFIFAGNKLIKTTQQLDDYIGLMSGIPTYDMSDKIISILDNLACDGNNTYNFQDYNDFISRTTSYSRLQELNREIVDAHRHPSYNGNYKIEMTGSRFCDYGLAADQAGCAVNVDGYTWHHLATFNAQDNTCTMVLMETKAHSHPHFGAVHQWETFKNGTYH